MAKSAHAADKIFSAYRTCVTAALDCARVNSAHAADKIFSAYRTCVIAALDCAAVIAAHAAYSTILIFDNYSAAVRTVLEYAAIIIPSAYTSPQRIELKI